VSRARCAEAEAEEIIEITVDGRTLAVRHDATLLDATLDAGGYIPHLCHHPDLPSLRSATTAGVVFRAGERITGDGEPAQFAGCGLCVVTVAGADEPQLACETRVSPGLVVSTSTPELTALRRARLSTILATHPHACLTCAQREGCSRSQCSANVPEAERCCELLGRCELEKLAAFIGVAPDTPRYVPRGLPPVTDDPLFLSRPELCVSCLRCVSACNELKGVGALGFVRRGGEIVVGLVAADRAAAGCRYCGACVEVCPTGSLTDAAASAARETREAPCRDACPSGMDVPRFLRAVASGDTGAAARVALDRLPLPNALGRICFHPCEEECRRRELGGALSVCRVRRHVFDALNAVEAPWPPPADGGARVAVVGAGPAGLAAAHFLRRLGHEVTVFEAEDAAGGMLLHCIPAYRLPREALERDLALLRGQGIEFRFGAALGHDITLDGLKQQGFAAVVLGVGAGAARVLPVTGADLAGVHPGVDFLRDVAAGRLAPPAFAGRAVLVVGGGNVAVDAARSALRLGTASVTLACLEASDEMPAYAEELAAARAEGVAMITSVGVGELLGAGGSVRGARLVRCLAVFDERGRFAPRLDPTVTREVAADVVILAIGQQVAPGFVATSAKGLEFRGDGFLAASADDLATSIPGVFACGDVTLGPSSVVRSIASGRKAAEATDRFLGGSGEVPSILDPERPAQWLGPAPGFAARTRACAPESPLDRRAAGFAEVEATLSAADACGEAGRCLQCGLRFLLHPPTFPPPPWRRLVAESVADVPAVEGVYQLLGEDRVAVKIAGAPNLREALAREAASAAHAPYFVFEADPMFTKRESELIQQFLGVHGRMPAGDADLDDLF
jgi:formate dehydrogenase beta subunit